MLIFNICKAFNYLEYMRFCFKYRCHILQLHLLVLKLCLFLPLLFIFLYLYILTKVNSCLFYTVAIFQAPTTPKQIGSMCKTNLATNMLLIRSHCGAGLCRLAGPLDVFQRHQFALWHVKAWLSFVSSQAQQLLSACLEKIDVSNTEGYELFLSQLKEGLKNTSHETAANHKVAKVPYILPLTCLTFNVFAFFTVCFCPGLTSNTSHPLPVGNSDLPSSPSRAEVGDQRYREWAEEGQPERSCLVSGLVHHGQALLPLVKRQARAGGGSWAFCRQVSVNQSYCFYIVSGPGMIGVIPGL